jgi:tRNA1Val (adenine37-N6)-methyltransferase
VLQETLQEHQGEYDSIVSNPPFFIDALAAPDEQRNMARHTATLTYAELMQAAY